MSRHVTSHYVAEEWPHGLRCAECDHLYIEGETLHKQPHGMLEDGTPVLLIVCWDCALGVAA